MLINDVLIFDQLMGSVSANPTSQSSTYNPETTTPQLLKKAYLIPETGPTQNETMYYVRPKSTLSSSGESAYYQFSYDFNYWKLLAYYFYAYYPETNIDMSKYSMYFGFELSDLWWQYPHFASTNFFSESSTTNGKCSSTAYNMDTK